MATEPADLEPKVIIIEDEFSTMSNEDYDAALAAWLAEADPADAVVVPVSAAETLRDLREHGEA
jgi:predicted phosphoadenosine phosphosulfate sulfurtransferase